jgi:hypothetical protein
MKIGDKTVADPQLSHHNYRIAEPQIKSVVDREHYALNIEFDMCGEKRSYSLIIRHYWKGGEWNRWNHYSFGEWEMGDFEEIVSREEAESRYNAVLENEGEEAAKTFQYPRVIRGIETDIKLALIRRWEALCELVSFNVTH